MTWLNVAAAVMAVLAGLGATATYIALGTQRGRLKRLEDTNGDLRLEITDEQRRSERMEAELRDERVRTAHCAREIERLQRQLDTMQEIVSGVSGPIAALSAVMERTNELLAVQHAEAMTGQEYMYALQIDTLRLLGDTRHPARIKAELRTQERGDGATDQE